MGCSQKFVVSDREGVGSLKTWAVVPVQVNESQAALQRAWWPLFHEAVSKELGARVGWVTRERVEAELKRRADAGSAEVTWDAAWEAARAVGAEGAVAFLIEEGDRPGKLIEIVKLFRTEDGRLLASNNWGKRREDKSFEREAKALGKLLR